MTKSDLFFSQQNMNLLCRDESCSVYQMKNETGDGTATYYEVYPGVGVMYNDFHMEHCPSRKFEQNTHTLQFTIAEKAASSGKSAMALIFILRPAILCWTVLPRKTTIAAFP